jgi:SAM-dependent methyltransferase
MPSTARQIYARLYDVSPPEWPGEIAFYRALALGAKGQGRDVLELACGTGRVALRLAQDGVRTTGLDLCEEMLALARAKSVGYPNAGWVQGDMRSFELGPRYGLAIIPAHSFQFMLTPEAQLSCLGCVNRHLVPGGKLVLHLDHQDLRWLGGLVGRNAVPEAGRERLDPVTGHRIRPSHAWAFEPSTQTATVAMSWEDLDTGERWQLDPMALHCAFRFEIEHLLCRTDFGVDAVFGGFRGEALTDASGDMIWIAGSRSSA